MNESQELLSDIVVYSKYARYIPELQRRETWEELISRYLKMLQKRYPHLHDEIGARGKMFYTKEILPSMRALQFAGQAIEKNESRVYNCAYMPINHYKSFAELMFLLLGGTGVGYSVQFNHVEQLPDIQKPVKSSKFLVGDSIEGWADAVKQLMKAYFGITKVKPRFDYSDVRPKGAPLITAGGKAPGPDPLRISLTKIEAVLNAKEDGEKLTPFECHYICCLIAEAVRAGGIRRAALISLFSFDDHQMATCKHGSWWENYPELGRANNSATILRSRIKEDEFKEFWKLIEDSGSGEPGVYFTNDTEYGTNPCCEISLRPYTFCNLVEINGGATSSKEHFIDQVKNAAFFGTLQAGFTDFHYLRPIWQRNTEKDALVGVGITGIANNQIKREWLEAGAHVAKLMNAHQAEIIGINKAARVTTIKPSGTTSCVLGTSSGIHAWHEKYYIRNMQCKIGDDLYTFFTENYPELIKIMDYDPESAVIGIPQEAPDNAILREDEDALAFLERVLDYNVDWVRQGHNRGPNTNNVSATISVKPHEWVAVGDWMWSNRAFYNGLSVLPFDGGTYKDAPFMSCTKEEFDAKIAYIKENPIDLTLIKEEIDNTDLAGELACAGGKCDLEF